MHFIKALKNSPTGLEAKVHMAPYLKVLLVVMMPLFIICLAVLLYITTPFRKVWILLHAEVNVQIAMLFFASSSSENSTTKVTLA